MNGCERMMEAVQGGRPDLARTAVAPLIDRTTE